MRIARLCLLLLLLLIPLVGGQAGVVPLSMFGVLAAFGWLGWALERDATLPVRFPLRRPLLALLAITVAATFTSVYLPASVLGIWQVAVLAGATLLAAAVPLDRRQLFIGALAFCAGLLASFAYGWYQWADWLAGEHEFTWRIMSTWGNPNYYAAFLVLVIPLLLVLARRAPLLRWAFLLAGLLSFATLVMTQSRGALLALLLCLLVFLPLWGWVEGRLSARALGLGAAGFALFIGLVLLSPLGKRVLDPAVRARQLHSQTFRVYTWQGSLRLLRDYPALGSGPNTFASVFGKYQQVGYTRNAHSIYLQAATETGAAGLLALLWLFGAVLAAAWRAFRAPGEDGEGLLRRSAAVALFAGVLGLLLHGFLDSVWTYPGIQFAVLLPAVLVWRLAEPQAAVKAAGRARVLLPGAMLLVAALLVPGAYAQVAADAARDMIARPGYEAEARQERGRLYGRAVRLAPANTAYLREASFYVSPDEGEKLLRRAQRLEPTNPANWIYQGRIAQHVGDYPALLSAMTAAEEKQPYLFPALLGIAQARWKLGDPAGCRAALEKIVSTQDGPRDRYRPIDVPEPFYTQAWYALARLDLRAGDRDAAIRKLERALESARRFTEKFADEASALAALEGGTGGYDTVQEVRLWSHRRLAALLATTDPAAAAHRAAADALRASHFAAAPPAQFADIPDTPFPGLP
jgi:O-antigen ligase